MHIQSGFLSKAALLVKNVESATPASGPEAVFDFKDEVDENVSGPIDIVHRVIEDEVPQTAHLDSSPTPEVSSLSLSLSSSSPSSPSSDGTSGASNFVQHTTLPKKHSMPSLSVPASAELWANTDSQPSSNPDLIILPSTSLPTTAVVQPSMSASLNIPPSSTSPSLWRRLTGAGSKTEEESKIKKGFLSRTKSKTVLAVGSRRIYFLLFSEKLMSSIYRLLARLS